MFVIIRNVQRIILLREITPCKVGIQVAFMVVIQACQFIGWVTGGKTYFEGAVASLPLQPGHIKVPGTEQKKPAWMRAVKHGLDEVSNLRSQLRVARLAQCRTGEEGGSHRMSRLTARLKAVLDHKQVT
jgi:hypothetical protein